MKRLWPFPVLLLLALPLRAQQGDAGAQEGEAPPSDSAPAADPNSSESQPAEEGGAPVAPNEGGDKPAKEEPVISVKIESRSAAAGGEEGGESGVATPAPTKKIESAAILGRGAKKGKRGKSARSAKAGKDILETSAVSAKAKTSVIPPEPPPPPVPAVPLTPITPRNP